MSESSTPAETPKPIEDITMADILLVDPNGLPLNDDFEKQFARLAHVKYILNLDKRTDSFEYYVTEHLRMSGVYWGVMAIDLIGGLHLMDKQKIIEFVLACYDAKKGGFRGNVNHDANILYTLSALQILAIFDHLHVVDVDTIVKFVVSMQKPNGAFTNDEFGEIDTRFTYCSLNILALLNRLPRLSSEEKTKLGHLTHDVTSMLHSYHTARSLAESVCESVSTDINLYSAISYVVSCYNFDGGFGAVSGAESHSGQMFCCLGVLAMTDCLDVVNTKPLGWWLCERQLSCGGLNGRPEKKEDVCYSWWVLSCLSILKHVDWINSDKLIEFIMAAQDAEYGGISDRPDNMTDIFHTYFGFSGLSLLGCPGFHPINPIYALPERVVEKLNLPLPTNTNNE